MLNLLPERAYARQIGLPMTILVIIGVGIFAILFQASSRITTPEVMEFTKLISWLLAFTTLLILSTEYVPKQMPLEGSLSFILNPKTSAEDRQSHLIQLSFDLPRAEAEEILPLEDELADLARTTDRPVLLRELLVASARTETPRLRQACAERFADYAVTDRRLTHEQAQALAIVRCDLPPRGSER